MKILAVDDDGYMLELLQVILMMSGFRDVSFCLSGQQALSEIGRREDNFECIILDIQMPEMNGLSLCRKIRAMDGYDETPIIMLTAMSDLTSIQGAFSVGATDYITKPFDVNEIAARVRVAKQMNSLQNELKALRRASLREMAREERVTATVPSGTSFGKMAVSHQEIAELVSQELTPFPMVCQRAESRKLTRS